MDMQEFLNPRPKYHGYLTPQNLIFNSNLQEFTTKVSYIVALETNGKLTPREAYKQIKCLWKSLKMSKKNLLEDGGTGDRDGESSSEENKE
jgi:hypothetical protein